jgi:hypothetical protein
MPLRGYVKPYQYFTTFKYIPVIEMICIKKPINTLFRKLEKVGN